MNTRNVKSKELSFLIYWVLGCGICITLFLLSAALVGTLMINEMIDNLIAGYICKILVFLAVFVGTITVLLKSKLPAISISAVICATIILVQLIICAFSEKGIGADAIMNSLIILAGAAAGVATRLKSRSKNKHIKRAYR